MLSKDCDCFFIKHTPMETRLDYLWERSLGEDLGHDVWFFEWLMQWPGVEAHGHYMYMYHLTGRQNEKGSFFDRQECGKFKGGILAVA